MSESSSEMNAEDMTGAMSLEEKPQTSSILDSDDTNDTETSQHNNYDKSGDACSTDENDQVGSAENSRKPENSEQHDKENSQPFALTDPINLLPYIEKYMMLKLEKNYTYTGFIHSIDPISHSVILSVPREDGTYQTLIIPGTSVLEIKEVPCDSGITPPERKPATALTNEDLQLKKKKVLSWLKDNRIPVTEDGDKVVFGGITLLPPYGEKDICTTNSLIATEIRSLIVKMPDNYEPK